MSLKLLITACLLNFGGGRAGYAPMEAPKLPAGFCPRETGSITETTGGEEFLSISFRYIISYVVFVLQAFPYNNSSLVAFFLFLKNACAIGNIKMAVWEVNVNMKWD